MTRVTIHIPKI